MKFKWLLLTELMLENLVNPLRSRRGKEVWSTHLFAFPFTGLLNNLIYFFLAPEAAPTQVRAEAVNSTTIRVWWKPPDPQLINGINQGYKLQAWRGNVTFI